MTFTHRCCGEKETLDFAIGLAAGLRGGEVFALEGDLGCGKTTFVRGLALGLGCPAAVTSPTFNLVHRYTGGRLEIAHLDLYRLKKAAELEALDLETLLDGSGVIAVEWPRLAATLLPAERTCRIEFSEPLPGERLLRVTRPPI